MLYIYILNLKHWRLHEANCLLDTTVLTIEILLMHHPMCSWFYKLWQCNSAILILLSDGHLGTPPNTFLTHKFSPPLL